MKNRFTISLMHKKLNENELLALCEMEYHNGWNTAIIGL